MWITLQKDNINFNNVFKYYIEGSCIYIVNLLNITTYYIYNTEDKAKKVKEFIDKKLKIIESEM